MTRSDYLGVPLTSDLARTQYVEPIRDRDRRTRFQHDRDRVLHSEAFRRLQYKTQVYVVHEGDSYRTRMTHSLEVAQIARGVAAALDVNEDLVEAIALAHDIGHGPFGHKAEEELCSLLAEHDIQYDHNLQAYRVATELEERYGAFPGLNLSWATLEGILRHSSFFDSETDSRQKAQTLLDRSSSARLYSSVQPHIEAQIVNLSDVIAYATHDIEDALNAGLLTWERFLEFSRSRDILFVVETIDGPFADECQRYVERTGCKNQPTLNKMRRRICSRLMINRLMSEAVTQTIDNLSLLGVPEEDTWLAARASPNPMVRLPAALEHQTDVLVKDLLLSEVYNDPRVLVMIEKAKRIVRLLFETFMRNPDALPVAAKARFDRTYSGNLTGIVEKYPAMIARVVGDHISGMTDKYAMDTYQTLFDTYEKAL